MIKLAEYTDKKIQLKTYYDVQNNSQLSLKVTISFHALLVHVTIAPSTN